MSTIQKIAKNTSVMFIAQIMTYGLGFFITMYTAQYLGAEGFGILSLALSITAIFGIIGDMGLGTLMVREIARDKTTSNKYISNIALIKVILSLLMFTLIVLTVNIIGYNKLVSTVIYLITISVVINAFGGVLTAIFQASERMEYLSGSTILNSVLMFLGTMIGIYYKLDILFFASLYIIANSLVLIYIIIVYIKKFDLPKIEVDTKFWKPTIKEAWPFGITSLSGMLYTYIDSIMLSIMQGNEVVGWYSAAYRLMLITLFIPNAINTAVFPVMSRLYNSSRDSLTLMYEKYFKYMLIIGIPMGFGTTLLSDKIILLIFGQGYTQSIPALQILIWTMVFTFTGAAFVQLLQSINKQLIITKISMLCVVINVVLNLILIPRFSFIGASFATLITEIVLVGYVLLISYKLGYGISYEIVLKNLSKVLVATVVMSISIWYLRSLSLFLLIFIGILIYFISLYLVRGVDEEDIFLIKEILNKN
jgi:O-antigen/teichoic acid export membrane protein